MYRLKDLATFHVQWERRFPSPEGANPLSAAATPAGALLAKASSKVSASEQEVEFKKLVQEQFGDDAMNHAFVEQLSSKLLDVGMQGKPMFQKGKNVAYVCVACCVQLGTQLRGGASVCVRVVQ